MSDFVQRRAGISQHGKLAGYLEEEALGTWTFTYIDGYAGAPVSLTMPVPPTRYEFDGFPAVFEGLLPEGPQLEALLRKHKIDRNNTFQQLVTVGADLVGSLTVREASTVS